MTKEHTLYDNQRRRIYTKQDNAHKHAHKNQNFKQETKIKNVTTKTNHKFFKYKYSPINDYYISIRYRLSIPKHATNIENGK